MKRPWFAPLVPLYAAGVALRDWRLRTGREAVRRLQWPVISVGSLSAGGAGKTPLAIALARGLRARGVHVDVLSRGFGRRSRVPLRVDPDGTAELFGDEPLLIARATGVPVYVAAQRYEAGLLAEAEAASHDRPAQPGPEDAAGSAIARAHILDDGFQHRQLARDVDIVLVSPTDWHDHLLPAGNLREPLPAATRASVLAIPSGDPAFENELRAWGWRGPVWRLRRQMRVPAVDGPVLAFCGIARPEQFFAGMESAGLRVVLRKAFPDHHAFTAQVVERLAQQARQAGAVALVTTEKDAARLGPLAAQLGATIPLKVARLTAEIDDETSALDWLLERLARSDHQPAL